MFHKNIRVKSSNAIKASDSKKWKSLVEARFPMLSADEVTALLPSKGDLTVTKIVTQCGSIVNVLSHLKNPLFFDVDGIIYPTVYSLWTYPHMLPVFTTTPDVLPRMKGGADLMLPGVIFPSGWRGGMKSFGILAKGAPCAINLANNGAAVAVGKTTLSTTDMYLSAMRGKGVDVLHTYEDLLWAMGDKTTLPPLEDESRTSLLQEAAQTGNISDTRTAHGALDVDADNATESETGDVQTAADTNGHFETMDDLLYYSCMKALKTTAKKEAYPVLTGRFYSAHVLPCVPDGHTLNLKNTSYKKLPAFMQCLQEKQLLQVQELNKGIQSIVSVNFEHPEIRHFVVDESDRAGAVKDGDLQSESLAIEELYLVSSEVLPLFRLFGCVKSTPLTASDVRAILTKYVKKNDLQRESLVLMDPILTDMLLTKSEFSRTTHLKWDAVNSRCLRKMNPGYRIVFPSKEPILRKGKVEPIELSIASRAGNKKVTLIHNLEVFGIDPSELAHTVRIGVAASTSVSPAVNRKEGFQVLVQGNQVAFIGKLLLDEYKINKKYIRGLELAPKNKRV